MEKQAIDKNLFRFFVGFDVKVKVKTKAKSYRENETQINKRDWKK